MAFYGKTFIFDGVPSETYGLAIYNFDQSVVDSNGGGDIEIITDQLYRRPVPYLLGVQQKPVLEFDITFGSETPLDATTRSIIGKWLFGRTSYKKLQIVQCDMQDYYYNCFITESKVKYIGNLAYGVNAHVVCDAPWGWESSKTITKTYSGGAVSDTINLMNYSSNTDYTYPIITFTLSNLGNYIYLLNTNDPVVPVRQFGYTSLNALEKIVTDNDKQIITSYTLSSGSYVASGLLRVANFTKIWFRMVPGMNRIQMASNGLTSFQITYQFARKVGG